MVGRPGNSVERRAVLSASALSLPDFTNGVPTEVGRNVRSTCPPITADAAGPPPPYGICVQRTPARFWNSSAAMCGSVPMPGEE